MNLKKIIKHFVFWRLILIFFTLPAAFLLPLKPGFTLLSENFSFKNLILLWSNFDGQKYLNLAINGYGTPQTIDDYNLFPFYPWLIKTFNIFNSPLATALIISHFCLILSLIFIYKIIKFDYPEKIALKTIHLFLIFPTAFFLVSVYSESLFLFLSSACIYFARKKNYLLSSALAALCSYTRFMGIFLIVFLIIEFWLEHQKNIKSFFQDYRLITLLIPPLGLISYLRHLEINTGDALIFLRDKPLFSPDRVISKIVLLYQVFFRYLKMLIFMEHNDPLFFTVLLEFIVGATFLFLVIISFRKLRLSYAVYSLFIYLIPTLTGSFASLPRYIIILFPLFIIITNWFMRQTKNWQIIYLAISLLFSFISISLFSRGYFIS